MKLYTRIILLISLFLLNSSSAFAVTANFTADYTAGCPPLVVHFTNTSSGATSYSWDLGNGAPPSPLVNVSGSYLTTGTYTVTLTAYNGSATSVKTMVITVYPLPTISFSASDTALCPGIPTTFTSTSTGGTPGPMTYIWNFGDGHNSTIPGPVYTYTAPGYYNVTLSVTNSQGCTKSLTEGAYIHVFTPASINFAASPSHFCNPPATVTFLNYTTGTPPLSYSWSFGDLGTSTLAAPVHTYLATGSYNVDLTVVDGNGCKDSLTIPAGVTITNLTAAFTYPSTACVFSNVLFLNTSGGHLSSSWNFGDGYTSPLENPYHMYNTAGTYTVTLIIFDGTCYDTVHHTITILPEPASTFTVTPAEPCPAPTTISFNATVPAGASVSWDFGDRTSGAGASTSHLYSRDGVDTVTMVVTSSFGCKDTLVRTDTIYDLAIDVNEDTIISGCVPLTVNFNCYTWTNVTFIHNYPYGITSYTWNFGDGSPSITAGSLISHTYTAVGVYYAKVVVTTGNGCIDTFVSTVLVGTPPVAGFTAAPMHICADHGITFTNTSIGADSYFWMFGDGTSSILCCPIDTFAVPGTYTVTLVAYFHGCPDTFRLAGFVVDSPEARYMLNYVCRPPTSVQFMDTSYGDDSHIWFFGDSDTSTLRDPVHNYPALSTYTVTLTTYNIRSGCRDTTHTIVDLVRPIPDFTARDTAVCRDEWIYFTPHITIDSAIAYYWYRNWVLRDTDTSVVYLDTFHTTGHYTITLVIQDSHLCYDTLTKVNYVLVAKPVDSFIAMPSSGCLPLNVLFTDESTDVSGTTLTNFAWTFGDGGTASVGTPSTSHTYTVVGTFNVGEIVTDNIGCKDTVVMPSIINVFHPTAVLSVASTHPCPGVSDVFTNHSTGIISSLWFFGDGDTSSTFSPSHSYNSPGAYTVKLVVTDAHGCTDTATSTGLVTVTKPTASFYMNDSFSICAPLSVNFFNTSIGALYYSWTFGDGNSSAAVSPSDLYIVSGYDTVVLIASDAYGCKDTAYGHVNLYGYAGAFSYAPLSGCTPLTVFFHSTVTNVPSIIWDFSDGTVSSSSTIDSATHTYTIPGGYVPRLILSDNTGCQNSSVGLDTIKVDAVTSAFTAFPFPVCINTPILFTDSSTSYWSTIASWTWTIGGDTTSVLAPTYTYTNTGNYTVMLKVTDAWGCTATDTTQITVYPLPVITVSPDTIVCKGDPAVLTGFGGSTYSWAPPVSLSCTICNPVHASPPVATTYTVTGKDKHGCTNTDTVTVFIKTNTVSVGKGDTAICQGEVVPLSDSGGSTYTWIPATGLSSADIADPFAAPPYSINYMVIAQLADCIPDTNYVAVVVNPLPTVKLSPNQAILEGSTAQINATGTKIAGISWSNAASLSCDSCFDPIASPTITTTYVVSVKTNFGCKSSDTVTISVFCNSNQIFIPNSFTPNNDGKDDIFYPRGRGVSIVKSFRIYNRWGQLLFERGGFALNDESYGWDGTFQGQPPHPDVYVYIIEATCETGEPLFLKGDVTIIR